VGALTVNFAMAWRGPLKLAVCKLALRVSMDLFDNLRVCFDNWTAHTFTMTGQCGTVQWMAPEVLASERYTESADVRRRRRPAGLPPPFTRNLRLPYPLHAIRRSSLLLPFTC
jgi:serine/threonine protein kinase